jgi:hypothetical protein
MQFNAVTICFRQFGSVVISWQADRQRAFPTWHPFALETSQMREQASAEETSFSLFEPTVRPVARPSELTPGVGSGAGFSLQATTAQVRQMQRNRAAPELLR